jgi:phosphoribosylformylglycinamidine synthase
MGQALARAGNFLIFIGEPRDQLTGSAFAREILGQSSTAPPDLSLEREALLHELAVLAAEGGWVRAAHDVSDGGLATTLAEMVMACPADRALGADVDLGVLEAESTLALFSERPGVVFEVSPQRATILFQSARERGLLAWPIGTVTSVPRLRVLDPGSEALTWTAAELVSASARPLGALWNEEVEA